MTERAATETRLRELEESLWRSETRYDVDHMERTLHPDFVEFGQSGRTWTRQAAIDARGGDIAVELPLPELAISFLGQDGALVTYLSRYLDGTLLANRSSLWLRTDDGWRLRFHQGTPTTR